MENSMLSYVLDFFYWKQWTQPRNRWWGGSKFEKSEKSWALLPPLPWATRITLNTETGRKEEYYLLKTASKEVEVMEVPKLLMWGALHLVTSTDQVIGPNSSLWEGLLKSLSHPVHRNHVTKTGKWVWKIIPCVRVQQYWASWGVLGVFLRPRACMPTLRVSLFTRL